MAVKAASKARADLRRLKACDRCGAPVYVVTALDVTTGISRTLPVEPDPEPAGWFVVNNDLGAFMDSEFTLDGDRWERHVCPAKKSVQHKSRAPATTTRTPGLFMEPEFDGRVAK